MKAVQSAALGFVALALSLAPAVAYSNSARDYVKKREAAQVARVLGAEAAREFLRLAAPRIVGGTLASPGSWPQQVALLTKNVANNFNAQYCGGTLVHKRFVVTAAHCSDFVTSSQVQVLTGTQSLISGGTRRNVKKITIHPLWNDATFAFDVAIWELFADVAGIQPASMITFAQEAALASVGTQAVATGWGVTSNNGSASAKLRQVSVPIVSRSVCNGPSSYDGEVLPQMICAGASGKDSCQGDSGGPLWVRNAVGQFKVVAGITSWGYDCADPYFPGVYARLAVLSAWARQVIANASP